MSRPNDTPSLPAAVTELALKIAAGISEKKYEVIQLHGDASSRRYFRLKLKDQSFIVVFDAGAEMALSSLPNTKLNTLQQLAPEAFTSSQTLRFLFWTAYLNENNIPVPQVIETSEGAILLSDLGDDNLTAINDPSFDIQAIQKVADLHRIDFTPAPNQWTPLDFIQQKLTQEIDFLIQQLQTLKPAIAPEKVRLSKLNQLLTDETKLWQQSIHNSPNKPCLNHRDFHGRNVHVVKGKCSFIDYQDIFWAHPEYDVVSFIWDPYRSQNNTWSDDFRSELLAAYQQCNILDKELLWYYGLQRLTKCTGSYVWLGLNLNRPEFKPSLYGAIKSFESLARILERPLPQAQQELILVLEEILQKMETK